MSNVYTIIIYIVSMYSNIRGQILTLSYSISLLRFELGSSNRVILRSVFLLQVTVFLLQVLVFTFKFSIFVLAYLEYLHLMNLAQLVGSMFVYIDNNLYINICIIGN